jgi:AAA family ATP:ADP antiporter
MAIARHDGRSRLERWLGIFAEVHAGEGLTSLLLALNVFLILMAYYVLKPVREALILGGGSAELKSYMSALQVVLLAVLVPGYGRLVSKLPRMRLINVVTGLFAVCLLAFYAAAQAGLSIGVVFFLWIGVFNLMIVAQFWAFANDVYSKDQGERLFAIVGFGASLGAVVGARAAGRLIEPLGINPLLLLGAALLVVQVLITNLIDRREGKDGRPSRAAASRVPNGGTNAFSLVFRTRYLLLIALMLMLLNFVNTTGEYILGSIVERAATDAVAAGSAVSRETLIGTFYSRYFLMVNVLGLVLQLFVVSRIVKYWGVPWAVMILPALAFGAYSVLTVLPVLTAVLTAKVLENSTDYSLNNTVRNMLFLPCSYEQKFSGKQAIDSFFVRMGDVLSAVLVFAGTSMLGVAPRGFAAINALLVAVWLALAWRVGRTYGALTEPEPVTATVTAGIKQRRPR